jgi:hypothetical protein
MKKLPACVASFFLFEVTHAFAGKQIRFVKYSNFELGSTTVTFTKGKLGSTVSNALTS